MSHPSTLTITPQEPPSPSVKRWFWRHHFIKRHYQIFTCDNFCYTQVYYCLCFGCFDRYKLQPSSDDRGISNQTFYLIHGGRLLLFCHPCFIQSVNRFEVESCWNMYLRFMRLRLHNVTFTLIGVSQLVCIKLHESRTDLHEKIAKTKAWNKNVLWLVPRDFRYLGGIFYTSFFISTSVLKDLGQ